MYISNINLVSPKLQTLSPNAYSIFQITVLSPFTYIKPNTWFFYLQMHRWQLNLPGFSGQKLWSHLSLILHIQSTRKSCWRCYQSVQNSTGCSITFSSVISHIDGKNVSELVYFHSCLSSSQKTLLRASRYYNPCTQNSCGLPCYSE